MLVVLKDLLSAEDVNSLREHLKDAPFEDGKKTAHGSARAVKHNLQLDQSLPLSKELASAIQNQLVKNEAFIALTWAKRMQVLRFCKYETGMGYGEHLDAPTMGGQGDGLMRTDISMTLFLTPLDEYEGGELVFQSEYGVKAVRGDAGDAVIYPSNTIHRVNPVTAGERMVAITWIKTSLGAIERAHGGGPELLKLRSIYNQLCRNWLE